jgi:hypothetical protein
LIRQRRIPLKHCPDLKSPSPQVPHEKIQQHLEVNRFNATVKSGFGADLFIPPLAALHMAGAFALEGSSDAFYCERAVQIHVAFAEITPGRSTRTDQVAQVILGAATEGPGHRRHPADKDQRGFIRPRQQLSELQYIVLLHSLESVAAHFLFSFLSQLRVLDLLRIAAGGGIHGYRRFCSRLEIRPKGL